MGNILTPSLNAGLNIFNGLRKLITISYVGTETYDPAVGNYTGTTITQSVYGLVCAYRTKEIAESAGLITIKDKKVILMQKDITNQIDESSTLTISGDIYRVIMWNSGCDENTISVQIRR